MQVNDSYWADQVDIQRQTATAWITLAKGNHEKPSRRCAQCAAAGTREARRVRTEAETRAARTGTTDGDGEPWANAGIGWER